MLKKRKITEVLMECPECGRFWQVGECDCDADYPVFEDEGRLRCPVCIAVVKQIGEG